MIAPLNFEERAIVKAEVVSLSHSNPTGNSEQDVSDSISALPTDVTVIPYDVYTEGPLTYFRYYLEDADEFAHRSEQTPRSLQQKWLRTGLVGAGLLATLASGMAAIDALTPDQPDAKTTTPSSPATTTQPAEQQNSVGIQPAPQPTTPETIGGNSSSPLQFSLTPAPSIAQLGQSTAQLAQPTAPIPVLPELSGSQVEATQAAFSLPEPQLPTAPTIAALDSEAQPPLTQVQNNSVSNQTTGTASNFLNATPSGLLQTTEASPSNLVTNGAIASPISPPESWTAPLSSSNAASANPVQPVAADIPNSGQSVAANATQPSVTTIANNFSMPTVQTVANPDPSSTELALNPNVSTVTMPGDRLLEAVPRQPVSTVGSSAKPNVSVTPPSSELPQDVSPAVRNLLQPNAEVTGIQVTVMPLTQQESQEVATRDQLGQFKILRLSQPDYQQEWRTSNGDTNSPAPTFGFVDYPRQVIAVMQPLTPTSVNPATPSAQVSSVSVSAPETAIAE